MFSGLFFAVAMIKWRWTNARSLFCLRDPTCYHSNALLKRFIQCSQMRILKLIKYIHIILLYVNNNVLESMVLFIGRGRDYMVDRGHYR